MLTENELKSQITSEFIRWLCGMAEGFEYFKREILPGKFSIGLKFFGWMCETTEDFSKTASSFALFSLLLRRAIDGWNNNNDPDVICIEGDSIIVWYEIRTVSSRVFNVIDYKADTLTAAECAILDALLYVYKEAQC